jgi:hypothetical protein
MPDYIDTSYKNTESTYWFRNNLSIWIFNTDAGIHITYEDISKGILFNRIPRKSDEQGNLYTFDYYDSIYVPRRQKELKGI